MATVELLMEKVVEVEPAGMTTVGKLISAGEALMVIDAPPTGAEPVSAMLQVALAGGVIDTGLHEKPFNAGGEIVTVPPVADTTSEEPAGSEASELISCSAEEASEVEFATTRDRVAMVPLAMPAEFWPDRTHVTEPVPELQSSDLLAPLPAAPVLNVAELKSAVE